MTGSFEYPKILSPCALIGPNAYIRNTRLVRNREFEKEESRLKKQSVSVDQELSSLKPYHDVAILVQSFVNKSYF